MIFWEIGTLSINSLNRMQKGQYLEKMSHAWDCEVFCERYAENYPYSMMISQENAAHKLTGQLTVISRTPFEEYHRHPGDFSETGPSAWWRAGREGRSRAPWPRVCLRIFFWESITDAASFHTFYQMQGWKPENYCMIVLLGKENMAIAACTYHVKALRKAFPNALFCTGYGLPGQSDREIVCCLPLENRKKQTMDNPFPAEIRGGIF